MWVRFALILELLLLFISKSPCQHSDILIDNFDGPDKLRHWTFSNGAEFQGAVLSLCG